MSDNSPQEPDSRRMALIGLMVVVILVIGGYFLVTKLRAVSQLQDCVLQGRTNCAPVE